MIRATDPSSAPGPHQRGWSRLVGRCRRYARAHWTALLYLISVLFVVLAYLLWFDFHAPPINSNIGFDLYPLRQVSYATSPFDPYLWPGSYVPWALGMPVELYYGSFYTASGGSYPVGLFASVVLLDAAGAACLFYLAARWLARFGVRREFGLFATLIYAFNGYRLLNGFGTTDGYLSAGVLPAGDPAILIILAFLTYLALFRGRVYLFALGAFSFFAFSNFPTATLTLLQEYGAVLAVLLGFRWAALGATGRKVKIAAIARQTIGVAVALFVANAYLVYPLALVLGSYLTTLGSSTPAYTFSYGFDATQSVPNAVRLATDWAIFSPKAPPWAVTYLNEPLAVALSFFVPVLAFSAFLFLRRTSDVILYAMMVGTTVLSASINTPIGPAFVAATTEIPPFRAFYYGATFSPILLSFYCFFAPVSIGLLPRFLSRGEPTDPTPDLAPPRSPKMPRSILRPLTSLRAYIWPIAVAVIIVAASYPALTPEFSSSHAAGYPIDSTLPASYSDAASYLESSDPSAPTMVFPLVQPFDSNSVNGSTWYSGVNLYPDLIPNPSISSEYPSNYHGEDGDTLPVAGFVYDMGGSICASASCARNGTEAVPALADLAANESAEFATGNASLIRWSAGFSSDNVTAIGPGGSNGIEFHVNSSVTESNGHWMLGFLPRFENLSAYEFALINFTVQGASPGSILFGYHSFSPYGPGNAYGLGNYSAVSTGSVESVMIPLTAPTVRVNGQLSNVSDLFFVDDSSATSGWVNLTVDSLRLLEGNPFVAPVWEAGTPEDRLSLAGQPDGTALSFGVNLTIYEPNGHWALGYYPSPTNLSTFDFVVLNYTLSNLDANYLEFGFHSGVDYGPGSGFDVTSYLTYRSGDRYLTLIPLAAPTLSTGARLTNVTNLFLTYTPPSAESGWGFVNVSSIRLAHADADRGAAIAGALTRLGIDFVYVDTSVSVSNYVGFLGNYYNDVFAPSIYFERVFHSGTITIYRNLLDPGTFSSPTSIAAAVPTDAALGSLEFPWTNIYYNSTNLAVTYLPSSIADALTRYAPAEVTEVDQESATEYTMHVESTGPSVLESRLQYDDDWVARSENGSGDLEHFEVDGFANGWLLPAGSYDVVVSIPWATGYAGVEIAAFAVPPIFVALFFTFWIRGRSKPRRGTRPEAKDPGSTPGGP